SNCDDPRQDATDYLLSEAGQLRHIRFVETECISAWDIILPIIPSDQGYHRYGLFDPDQHLPRTSVGWDNIREERKIRYWTMAVLDDLAEGKGARWLVCNSPIVLAVGTVDEPVHRVH